MSANVVNKSVIIELCLVEEPHYGAFIRNGVPMGSIHKLLFNIQFQSFNHEI
jgi:hypothetical protein